MNFMIVLVFVNLRKEERLRKIALETETEIDINHLRLVSKCL